MARGGRIPIEAVDGWVEWTTEDYVYSYVPSLSCGTFSLLINRDAHWNVPYGYGEVILERLDEEGEPDGMPRSMQFEWRRLEMMAACAYLAITEEHPHVQYVVDAAERLWLELMEDDLEIAMGYILHQIRMHGAKTLQQLKAEWRSRNETAFDQVVEAALNRMESNGQLKYDATRWPQYDGAWILPTATPAGTPHQRATSLPISDFLQRQSPEQTEEIDIALVLNQAGRTLG